MRFKWAMVVARPGMCLMRLVKTLKRWSFDGGVLNVSMRFSHIMMRGPSELSPEPQRMFSRFELVAASDFACDWTQGCPTVNKVSVTQRM